MDIISCARAITKLRDRISEHGLEIFTDNNQMNYAYFMKDTGKRPGENVGVTFNTISPENSIFVYICETGESLPRKTIGVCAARLDSLGEWSLADYWKVHLQRIYTHEDGGMPCLKDEQPSFANKQPGRVAYLGELWVSKDKRGLGLAKDLVQLLMLLSWVNWKPDLVYGFMVDDQVSKGLASKYEWGMIKPMALRWERYPKEIPHDLWYVGSSPEDLEDLAYRLSQ